MPHDFTTQAIAALERDAYRDSASDPVPVDETSWALGLLTPEALEQLSVFLLDLSRRSPLSGPGWAAHRSVIEALESDIRRRLAREG